MTTINFTLIIEEGTNLGAKYPVATTGMTLGRSSTCDIAIPDLSLSRIHCRFEMRGNALWVTDLASANHTFVNGAQIDDAQLNSGDKVTVGDTTLRVEQSEPLIATQDLSEAPPLPTPPTDPTDPTTGEATDTGEVVIDLGFGKDESSERPASRQLLAPVIWALAAIVLLTLAVLFIMTHDSGKPKQQIVPVKQDDPLLLTYEKIEASPERLFRYELTLTPDHTLRVRIDDIEGDRHIQKEKEVDPSFAADLAREIENSGFFALERSYTGYSANENSLNEWSMTAVLGKKALTCNVRNREEPEAFRTLREKLETFSKNELGIWAIQHTAADLTQLARDTLSLAQKKYDERDVNHGNLYAALRAYREAEFYLDTVSPKPDFYYTISEGTKTVNEELDVRYRELNFRAERAINLADWHTAARELKTLCELIPERSDPRNREAARKLLDVEQRLQQERRR